MWAFLFNIEIFKEIVGFESSRFSGQAVQSAKLTEMWAFLFNIKTFSSSLGFSFAELAHQASVVIRGSIIPVTRILIRGNKQICYITKKALIIKAFNKIYMQIQLIVFSVFSLSEAILLSMQQGQ